MHEPGAQTIIGKSYPDTGVEQGRAVLADLAKHPATARHLAAQARAPFRRRRAAARAGRACWRERFLDTGGDLKEVAKALVAAPEAWDAPRGKLKRPGEWIAAALRATGVPVPDIRPILNAQNLLGEPLWRPPAPKGFPDDEASWLDGLAQRLDIANQLARRVAALVDPGQTADAALGPLASEQTRQAIRRAESRPQALALLLMAPEFQRR